MTSQSSSRLLIILSLCYGIAIGILGAFNSSALTIVAVIGGLVIGGLWAVRGLFFRSDRSA